MDPAEEAEFTAYVESRRARTRRTAHLLCRDWHRADDLTQIAFVKLYGAWTRIRDKAARDSYLRSCLVRAVIDESRRPWRREHDTDEVPDGGGRSFAPAGFGAPAAHSSDHSGSVADRQVVRTALDAIPPGQRVILVLRYYDGLDVAATASTLGCSEGNVKSQTARGLQALKAALGPEGLAAFGREVNKDA